MIIVTGNVIFRMYRVRQTCESKSGLGSAKRPGLPSSSVCDRTGPLQKGTWVRRGQDELPASPSRSGDQVCPQTTLVYICFKVELLTGPLPSIPHVSWLDYDSYAHPTSSPERLRFSTALWSGDLPAGYTIKLFI